ncbi:MAG TPA: SH3 domain-containing protein [Patescibacteria group bacterium]|nr:SH3 domain-containing protein [Patescibacteria group bacterium]
MAKTITLALLLTLFLSFPARAAEEAKQPVAPAKAALKKAAAAVKGKGEPTDPADNQPGGGLPVPRFVTLGPDEVNLRTGPGTRYPIKLVIRKGGLPVEVTREFEVWREVRDKDGDRGWVHKAMLSGRRAVIVKDQLRTLLAKPDPNAPPVVRLEPGVVADLETCQGDWCDLKIASYEGWIKRSDIWGVYPDETFKE